MTFPKTILKKILAKYGYKLAKMNKGSEVIDKRYSDFDEYEKEILSIVKEYTMTSPERVVSLIRSIEYIVRNDIKGDLVECGVWKGGSMMAMAYSLIKEGDLSRRLYLFDTFEGMTNPQDDDKNYANLDAADLLRKSNKNVPTSVWCYAPLEEVKANMSLTKYPQDKINFIKGPVEKTIYKNCIEQIALLRLDTDWYESTKHELESLFENVTPGGVIVIDDYGHWQGARKAVDEFIQSNKIKILLNRIDYTGRIAIKFQN